MGQLKKIRVREAKPRDLGLFRKLWQECIDESTYGPGTMPIFEELFNACVEADNGFVLLVADKGILIAGEAEAQFESASPAAQIWGIYVAKGARDKGVASAMLEEAKLRFKTLGHSAAAIALSPNQEVVAAVEKAGFKPFMTQYVLNAEEAKQ